MVLDDVSGKYLDPIKVAKARADELNIFDETGTFQKLTEKEVATGKEFVLKAFGRWSADKKKGAVPPGNPPKNDEGEEKEG